MQPTDSSFASFPEETFRSAIRSTMQMGMPTDPAKQLTWHWNRVQAFENASITGNPYNWTDTPVTDDPGNTAVPAGSLVVEYAISFIPRPTDTKGSPMGEFDSPRAIVTLLDDGYEQIKTADYVTIDGARWTIEYTAPPNGLFAVTQYDVYIHAEDES